MRLSDFWRMMDDEFGAAYAHSLARDHVLGALGNRTPMQAAERWLGKELRSTRNRG